MTKSYSYMIQIYSSDIEPMVKELASEDMRSIGNEVAWLIRKEYYSRHPKTLAELNSHAASIAKKTVKAEELS